MKIQIFYPTLITAGLFFFNAQNIRFIYLCCTKLFLKENIKKVGTIFKEITYVSKYFFSKLVCFWGFL